jgi:hypothetical protein
LWQFLFERHFEKADTGLTVGEVNRQLNRLAHSEAESGTGGPMDEGVNKVDEKLTRAKAGALRVDILRELLNAATPRQMSWIVKIILRELKVREIAQYYVHARGCLVWHACWEHDATRGVPLTALHSLRRVVHLPKAR